MNRIAPLFDYQARVVSLLGIIDHQQIDILVDHLLRLDTARSKPITLYVSSQGGSILDALKVVDIFQGLHSKVTAIGMGLIEGAGVIIFASASERMALPSCVMSTAGLYDIPTRQATSLIEVLQPRIELLGQKSPQLLSLIHRAARGQEFMAAPEAVRRGLADRMENKPVLHQPLERTSHVR